MVKVAQDTATSVQQVLASTESTIERSTAPLRNEVFRRFPILFILLVTFGFTAALTGAEQILLKIAFLNEHPIIMFVLGVGILIATGTLYKKLG